MEAEAKKNLDLVDTICALSSAKGRAALALIRVSGPRALQVAKDLGVAKALKHASPRLCTLKDGRQVLDEAVLTYYQSPKSFTGEDLLEISCHGNPVIVEQIIAKIVSCETRLAEAGEFTRRAIANEKMRLDQAEALNWVLNARTPKGVSHGFRAKLEGVGLEFEKTRAKFKELRADFEAQLDFNEHEVGQLELRQVQESVASLVDELDRWAQAYESNRHLLDQWAVALVGPPNSGKSSLFNALLGSDKSIVFDQPGTTRDLIEQSFRLEDSELVMIDSAGLRESRDPIEQIGVKKSREAMSKADLIVWVSDQAGPPPSELQSAFAHKKWILVASKSDLDSARAYPGAISVSSKTGEGLMELKKLIQPSQSQQESEDPILSSDRQLGLVREAQAALKEASQRLESGEDLEWAAESVTRASQSIENIFGAIPTDDVIRNILSRFCIGK